MSPAFSVLVNSSDGFEDCWPPFFTLFCRYWPDCDVPVLLNTELKEWKFAGLNVSCSQAQSRKGSVARLTWSECLREALDQLTTPLVLYMQEDYFLERPADVGLIRDAANLMIENPRIKHVGLTHFGSEGPFKPTGDDRFWEISPRARYRISTQAALWQLETLKSYVRPWENGWMFEIFGTRRSWRKKELFLTVNRERYGSGRSPVLQYIHTGIIKGQWHRGIPDLFERHGIETDFAGRGFYRPKPAFIRRLHLLSTILGRPLSAARSLLT
jgi:hypothetical protein